MTKTLKQRAVRSGSWVILGHLLSQGLRLGGNLILTRLLVPEMFGVITIVTVIMLGIGMFSDVGLLQNIVQSKRGDDSDYLNTAWTIQVVRGFFIFFILLVISYGLYSLGRKGYLSAETVYGNVELPFILAIMAITVVISGFNSIYMFLSTRNLVMGKLVVIELVSQITGLVFMLVWAWYKRDIWALVFGNIVSFSVKMLMSHTIKLGGQCWFKWERSAVQEIIHFGKWIFLSSIFGFLLSQGDRILLGGLISPEMLGVYTIAFFLASALQDVMSRLISSVFFPVLSETIRDAPENLENIYYQIRNKIDGITFFTAGFVYASGDLIIKVLYDSRYYDAGLMLQVLSLSLIATGFLLSKECFIAQGKPKVVVSITFIQMVAIYILIPLLFFKYGMLGAVWAIVAVSLVRVIVSSIYMKIYFFYDIKKEFLMIPLIFVGFLLGGIIKKVIIEKNFFSF